MIKSMDYFLRFDLQAASLEIQELGDDRGNHHEVFGDAIRSLRWLSEERKVTGDELAFVLGDPDRIRSNPIGEIWEYDWVDMYGPIEYSSTTPFQLSDGICIGLTNRTEK